jgi:hypothetical protein
MIRILGIAYNVEGICKEAEVDVLLLQLHSSVDYCFIVERKIYTSHFSNIVLAAAC